MGWKPPMGKENLNLWLPRALRQRIREDVRRLGRSSDTEHVEAAIRFYNAWLDSGLLGRLILTLRRPRP